MSGTAGPPAGLPPRPNFNTYDQQRNDSYRPLPPPPKIDYSQQNRDSHNRNRDAYQFGGNQNRNRGPDPYASRPTSYRGDPPTYPRGGLDSYRPPASDFSFRQEAPQGVDVARTYDAYRPSDSTRRRDDRPPGRGTRGHGRDNRGRGGYQGRGGARVAKKAADRPFLRANRSPTPELLPGMDDTEEHVPKFRALDETESSDEEVQNDENATDEDGQPKKKQAKTSSSTAADGNSVPKWSNPDPYTALPCPDESQAKKKDVVQLIRKARVSLGHDATKKPAETDDFISFNFDDDNDEDNEEDDHMSISSNEETTAPKNAPSGPRNPTQSFSHRDEVVGTRPVVEPKAQVAASTPKAKPKPLDTRTDPELGNRKRTFDDQIKGPSMTPKPVPKWPAKGGLVSEWKPKLGQNPTPWLRDHSMTEKMGDWLHYEIMDFFNRFKPIAVEEEIRGNLLKDLNAAVRPNWRDASIMPFGSYPAGLYLPTADMDMVFVSENYFGGGYAKYSSTSHLYRFRDFLYREGLAAPDSCECITRAKVPLVKYIDRMTALKMDVSFENDSGLVAIKTFQKWKNQYPAMPILTTVIKQFLCMRGLNEPVNGGIGGFTVTCLVVSMLQHMPQVQCGALVPEDHLGEMLLEFFNLYGNLFDIRTTAIQTEPGRWISKAAANRILYRASGTEKFCVIDPNDPGNDIAGGSSNTHQICKEFRDAVIKLNARMGQLRTMSLAERKNQSILEVILGGDYSSFDVQRNHLERVWQTSHDRI